MQSKEGIRRSVDNGDDFYSLYPAPFSKDQIVPVVNQLVNVSLKKQAPSLGDWTFLMTKRNFPLQRVLASFFNYEGEEAEEAANILTNDLKRFSQDKTLLRDPTALEEWLFKLTLGVWARTNIAHVLEDYVPDKDKDRISRNLSEYFGVIGEQIGAFGETLSILSIDDLTYYIRFEDMFYFHGTKALFSFQSLDPRHKLEKSFVENELALKESLLDEDENTWERLRIGWGVREIEDVVSLLPSIRSTTVMDHLVYALEDNLFDFSEKSKQQLRIDPLGAVDLLRYKSRHVPGDSCPLDRQYPRVVSKLEEKLEFENFSVPRKYLPNTAISLLKEIGRRASGEEFESLIRDIHALVLVSKEKVTVPWLITLVAQREYRPEISEVIEEMVSGLDIIPAIRETFLNKRSGKIWLNEDGRLRLTDTKTQLMTAFPVFTSSYVEDEIIIAEKPPEENEGQGTQGRSVEIKNKFLMSFFGEVGEVESNDVGYLISQMFQASISSLNEDDLLNEYEKLANEWKRKGFSGELLYLSYLNLSDKHIAKAKSFGIEAFYIKGQDVVFILEGRDRIGLQGRLDKEGQLLLMGMDESFIGEKEHLFLNNLALHLATQPLLYQSGIPEKSDKEIISETRKIAASWNRSSNRGSLPKIDVQGDSPCLAIRIPSRTEPVLVAEKLK